MEAAAKTKLARSIKADLCASLATFAALCVVGISIMATRNEDVRRQGVVFGFHCGKLALNITYRRTQSLQCVLKACPLGIGEEIFVTMYEDCPTIVRPRKPVAARSTLWVTLASSALMHRDT